jgi:hypothetical protein
LYHNIKKIIQNAQSTSSSLHLLLLLVLQRLLIDYIKMIPSKPSINQSIITRQRQPLHVHFADEVDNNKVKFISSDKAEGAAGEEDTILRTTDDDDDIEKVFAKKLQLKHDLVQQQRQQPSGHFSWEETSKESQSSGQYSFESSGQYSFEDTSRQYPYSPSEDSTKSYASLTLDEIFTIGKTSGSRGW